MKKHQILIPALSLIALLASCNRKVQEAHQLGMSEAPEDADSNRGAAEQTPFSEEILVKFKEGVDLRRAPSLLKEALSLNQRKQIKSSLSSMPPFLSDAQKILSNNPDLEPAFQDLRAGSSLARAVRIKAANESPGTQNVREARARLLNACREIEALQNLVEYCDTNGPISFFGVPADATDDLDGNSANGPYYGLQWNIENRGGTIRYLQPATGGFNSVFDVDVPAGIDSHTREAWAIDRGNGGEGIIVALVDTGVNYDHEDLRGSLWINQAELKNNGQFPTGLDVNIDAYASDEELLAYIRQVHPGFNGDFNGDGVVNLRDVDSVPAEGRPANPFYNGIDDDQNGKRDDIFGYNWAFRTERNPSLPLDFSGHGTFLAGIIAANGFNGKGIVGIAPRARIMSLPVWDRFGALYAIAYAINNGAHIIQNSWGSNTHLAALDDLIAEAYDKGLIMVFAAGNKGGDAYDTFPGSRAQADRVLVVGATDWRDNLLDMRSDLRSSTGDLVDLVAPGKMILSLRSSSTVDTFGGGSHVHQNPAYYFAHGTSMASAHVSGIAALLKAHRPQLSNAQIMSAIVKSAVDLGPPGWDPQFGFGRIHASAALNIPENQLDGRLPQIFFKSPGRNGEVSGRYPIELVFRDGSFRNLTISFRKKDSEIWQDIHTLAVVTQPTLKTIWDTMLAPTPDGDYWLKVSATDSLSGRQVVNETEFKLGNGPIDLRLNHTFRQAVRIDNASVDFSGAASVGDLDRDGKSEIIFSTSVDNAPDILRIIEYTGGDLGPNAFREIFQQSSDFADIVDSFVYDTDADGRAELLVLGELSPGVSKVRIYESAAADQFSLVGQIDFLHADGAHPGRLIAGDFDGNGKADVYVITAFTGNLVERPSGKREVFEFTDSANGQNQYVSRYALDTTTSRTGLVSAKLGWPSGSKGEVILHTVEPRYDSHAGTYNFYINLPFQYFADGAGGGYTEVFNNLFNFAEWNPPRDPANPQPPPYFVRSSAPSAIAFGDGNGDGTSDAVFAQTSWLAVAPRTSMSTNIFPEPWRLNMRVFGLQGPVDMVAADIDGDGNQDFVISNGVPGLVNDLFVFEQNAGVLNHVWRANLDINTSVGRVAARDFNGDGKQEIVVFSQGMDQLLIYELEKRFIRGDTDGNSVVNDKDAHRLLAYLFLGGPPPLSLDSGDTNDSGTLDITDAVYLLSHLFANGAAPKAPFPNPGTDPTSDSL